MAKMKVEKKSLEALARKDAARKMATKQVVKKARQAIKRARKKK